MNVVDDCLAEQSGSQRSVPETRAPRFALALWASGSRRLLRQPHGLEGLFSIGVGPPTDDLAVTELVGIEPAICDLHAAATPPTPVAHLGHHCVRAFDELLRLDVKLPPSLQPLLREPTHAVETPPRAGDWIFLRNNALPLGVM